MNGVLAFSAALIARAPRQESECSWEDEPLNARRSSFHTGLETRTSGKPIRRRFDFSPVSSFRLSRN